MGELIRAYDWSSTPVGPPAEWPQSLRLTVRLMLNSQHPMFIWWGPDLIQFYNDGYRRTMGREMHPSALGAKGRESWESIWPIIGPQIEYVMAGKGATWHENQMVPINRHGGMQEVWWTYGYSPIDLEGDVGGVLVVCTDVTETHRLTEELKHRSEWMTQLFENAPGFMASLSGPDHVFEMVNASYRLLIGGRNVLGKPVIKAIPEVADQGFLQLLNQVWQTGEAHVGRRTQVVLRDPETDAPRTLYLDFVYQPITDANGHVTGVFVQGQDVTDHVETENQLDLINRELAHRVRNIFAMVGAVASQTLRTSTSAEALNDFHARLRALASAQDVLAEHRSSTGRLGNIIRSVLAPHAPSADRIVVAGPPVRIDSKQAVSMSLALHELATNATKYGALSNEAGRVEVEWLVEGDDDKVFQMRWRELDGPPVSSPSRSGFGSSMLETVLKGELGCEVDIQYNPDGLEITLRAPLNNLHR